MKYHHILAAFDGSPASEKALQHAVGLAADHPGTKLTVAHVLYRPTFAMEGFGWVTPEGYQERIEEYERSLVQKAEAAISSLPHANVAVLTGQPAIAILEYAEEKRCDLIVMGSRGLGAIKEWMLGSVSHHVVQQSKVPVLIVK